MKKIISLALVVVMLLTSVIAFSSCGKEDDVLVMATNAAFPPYEYVEGNEFVGIDVEIAQAIAEKLGMTLQIEDVDFGAIIGGVVEGKYDMGMAGMTVTEERKQSVNFSDTYATGVQVIVVKEGSSITSVDDLFADDANYKVGVQLGTTGDIYATGDFGEENVSQYTTGNEAVQALLKGDVDCVIIDNQPAKAYVANNAGTKILETSYADEDYAICVSKANEDLLDMLNEAIYELIEDGTVAEIVNKYIKE